MVSWVCLAKRKALHGSRALQSCISTCKHGQQTIFLPPEGTASYCLASMFRMATSKDAQVMISVSLTPLRSPPPTEFLLFLPFNWWPNLPFPHRGGDGSSVSRKDLQFFPTVHHWCTALALKPNWTRSVWLSNQKRPMRSWACHVHFSIGPIT